MMSAWTSAELLIIGHLETACVAIWIKMQEYLCKKKSKKSSAKLWSFELRLNVLNETDVKEDFKQSILTYSKRY